MRTLGRSGALALLALGMLFWAGNWVVGRALRETFDPVALTFWRWVVAAVVLAPFAAPQLAGKGEAIRRHAGLLAVLALFGVAMFQAMVYHGLRSTTAVNGVLLNSSAPLFILLCAWAIDRERAKLRQVFGMLVSFAGILVILARGEFARLLELQFQVGDAWILLAMPVWGVYSVLLKRLPRELGGTVLLFVLSLAGVAMLAPFVAFAALCAPAQWPPSAEAAAGVLYVGLFASVGGFICWNLGVRVVGANTAGFMLHLLPAFATILAVLLLGESFRAFHAAGVATIIAGVVLATRRSSSRDA
jgi:drug/metabolite transporter (DMT)-like permease